MHRLAWLALYRSFTRHKLFTLVNIGGLALGVAVFLILALFVRTETTFDHALPGWDRTWIVQRSMQFSGAPEVNIPTRREMLPLLQADNPGLQGARLAANEAAVRIGNGSAAEPIGFVDPNYFTFFPLPVVAGDPAATLRSPDGAVITESVARTYLPGSGAIGRTLTFAVDGKPRLVRVGAVIRDLPKSITQRQTIFVRLMPDTPMFGRKGKGLVTFLRFDDEAAAARFLPQITSFNRRHPDPDFTGPADKLRLRHRLLPLASMHLREEQDRAVVAALGLVGLLVLLVAIGNYVNLATARAGLRAREVALRKVLGASRPMLVAQFLTEAIATTALAGLLGLALAELALPLVNTLGGTDLRLVYLGAESVLPPLAALIVLLGLVAGFYPALVLSGFQPGTILAAAGASGGGRAGRRLRATLVVLQFATAIALMIGTAVLFAQARHLDTADLGFHRDGLLMVPAFGDEGLDVAQRHDLAAALAALPGVTGVTQSSIAAGGGSYGIATMHRDGATGPDPNVVQDEVGPGFFALYGARLLAGRWLDPTRFAGDDAALATGPGRKTNLLLNRTAVSRLGFASPADAIGRAVNNGGDAATIVGVIEDFRFTGPRAPVEPQAYLLKSKDLFAPVLAARYTGANAQPILDRFEATWRRIAPNVPFQALTVDQQLYEQFQRTDAQRTRLFTAGAALAVLIGCIGLYGLAAFDTERRIKEIGIRKALGASTRDVLQLLLAKFLRPVLIANLIAWPLAWVSMERWLAGFDDRIALTPWYFLLASALAAAIAILTVLGQSWRVARAEPARALRYE
ncbi:ABC transporter permease [Sphingomonas azotifigens]|uniref:ABC transporter permease n=1 Tax=Sphingomonas azotifigens TaxID=330920 RepID=UPI000A0688D7|nr:ABC transporter permease [Sphingomonas azotifigens]